MTDKDAKQFCKEIVENFGFSLFVAMCVFDAEVYVRFPHATKRQVGWMKYEIKRACERYNRKQSKENE